MTSIDVIVIWQFLSHNALCDKNCQVVMFCVFFSGQIIGYVNLRADERLGNHPQGNHEPSAVKNKVERPQVSLG